MRKLVLVFAIASAIGCKPHPSSKLEGHWKGTRADGVAPGVQDAANAFATQTEIIARGNMITVSTPGPNGKGQPSPYVIDGETHDRRPLHTEKDGAGTRRRSRSATTARP